VVDPQLRVRGLGRLRGVDASVIAGYGIRPYQRLARLRVLS